MVEACYPRGKGRNLTVADVDDPSTCSRQKADDKELPPSRIVCMHSIAGGLKVGT